MSTGFYIVAVAGGFFRRGDFGFVLESVPSRRGLVEDLFALRGRFQICIHAGDCRFRFGFGRVTVIE